MTRNPSVSNWGFSGYITVLPKEHEMTKPEGVAAPLEPTQDRLNFRANLEQDWMSQQTIMDFSNWLVEQLWIARHGQIKADSMYLAFCGGRPTGEVIDWKAWERVANCANQSAAAVSKNLQEELDALPDKLEARSNYCLNCGGKLESHNPAIFADGKEVGRQETGKKWCPNCLWVASGYIRLIIEPGTPR